MYDAYFGLANLPFCIAPDPRFYVDAAPHRTAIRALQDRLAHGDEFVPLIGEFGVGKTTIGRRLLQECDRKRQLVAELPRMRIDGDQLFDRVAEAFGMRREGAVPPLWGVIRQLEGLARDGCDALLLVDEAHQLDLMALRRLRKLTAVRVDGRAALRVCLAGRSAPQGIDELRRLGQPLSIGAPVHVEPLDAAGTHDYILERLGRAGWQGRPAFASATVAIHERCKGNPGRVNRLCGHILLQLYIQGRDEVNAEVVHAVDELLKAELRGEPATLALPPLLRETPVADAPTPAPAAARAPAGLDGEALMTRLIAKTAAPVRLPDRVPAVPVPTAATRVPAAMPRRRGVAQAAGVLALLVSGGFLWQMVLNVAAARSQSVQHAAATAAASAGLAAMAEQALAQAPPAATQIPIRAEFAATAASTPLPRAPRAD